MTAIKQTNFSNCEHPSGSPGIPILLEDSELPGEGKRGDIFGGPEQYYCPHARFSMAVYYFRDQEPTQLIGDNFYPRVELGEKTEVTVTCQSEGCIYRVD